MKQGIGAAWLTAALLGCDGGPPPAPPAPPVPAWNAEREAEAAQHEARLAALEPARAGALEIHLAFGSQADLDLYVTGPLEETVYFANSPSGIGGELREDRRCTHEGPRIETVRFPAPLTPGRYRVGVDYPRACGEANAPAPFALRIDAPAGTSGLRGLAAHRVFEPAVLELEVAGGAPVVAVRLEEEQ